MSWTHSRQQKEGERGRGKEGKKERKEKNDLKLDLIIEVDAKTIPRAPGFYTYILL